MYTKEQITSFAERELDVYGDKLERAIDALNDGSTTIKDVRDEFCLVESTRRVGSYLVPRWGWVVEYDADALAWVMYF